MYLDYQSLVLSQELWKKTLPSDKAIECIALSRELMHFAIDHENQLPNACVCVSSDFTTDAIHKVLSVVTNRNIESINDTGKIKIVAFK